MSISPGSLLIGGSGSRSDTRSDFLTFPANSATAQLCFRHMNDTVPCESSINGTVRLNDNSGVEIVEPSSALVIIQDDDRKYSTKFTALQIIDHVFLFI